MKPAVKYFPKTQEMAANTLPKEFAFDKPNQGNRFAGFLLNKPDTVSWDDCTISVTVGNIEVITEGTPVKSVWVEQPANPNDQAYKFGHFVPAQDKVTITLQHTIAPADVYNATATMIITDEETPTETWLLHPSIL